jgi:hypothetical protein
MLVFLILFFLIIANIVQGVYYYKVLSSTSERKEKKNKKDKEDIGK